jgi:signal transduction histidine kinase
MDEKLTEQYREILENFLLKNDESELYKASMLSSKLINNHVDPDEIVATHFEIFDEIIDGFPPEKVRLAYNDASTVLLELMMSYAVAYREYMEMHENLYLKEREMNEFLELFLSILSHDLKSPLITIMGYNEFISKVCKNAGDYQATIRNNADKMMELIGEARTYSQVRAGEPDFQPADLASMLSGIVSELEYKATENKMTVKQNYDPELKYEVNGTQFLKHAFINILDNAIKYSPPGTTVEIAIADLGEEWEVYMKDQGEGVPDESKQLIFERFVRVSRGKIKGSGIGLAIVKTTVTQNKGRVWVEDNPEGGAIFCIALPKCN